jgi:hypothetical protein
MPQASSGQPGNPRNVK